MRVIDVVQEVNYDADRARLGSPTGLEIDVDTKIALAERAEMVLSDSLALRPDSPAQLYVLSGDPNRYFMIVFSESLSVVKTHLSRPAELDDRLTTALRFYSNPDNYRAGIPGHEVDGYWMPDDGFAARTVLNGDVA